MSEASSPSKRPARSSTAEPASSVLLREEYFERLKLVAYGKFYGRVLFLILLIGDCAYIGLSTSLAGRVGIETAIMLSGSLLGFYWYLEELTHIRTMRLIAELVAEASLRMSGSGQKRAYEKWDDDYIRFHYRRLYEENSLIVLRFEPLLWTMVILLVVGIGILLK